MGKVGIIDLGTNTFNLLIANVNGLNYKVLHKTKIAVKLGEGGIHKGFIIHFLTIHEYSYTVNTTSKPTCKNKTNN